VKVVCIEDIFSFFFFFFSSFIIFLLSLSLENVYRHTPLLCAIVTLFNSSRLATQIKSFLIMASELRTKRPSATIVFFTMIFALNFASFFRLPFSFLNGVLYRWELFEINTFALTYALTLSLSLSLSNILNVCVCVCESLFLAFPFSLKQ
jgi:hypothetical protein